VFYDAAVDRLFLAGASDFGTPPANLFEFTTAGALVSESQADGLISAISGFPDSNDFTISQGNTLSRITRSGSVVNSQTLGGVVSLAGVALNPTTGHLWVAESIGDTDTLRELDADFNLLQTVSLASLFPNENVLGLEIDPLTGNFLAALPNRIAEFDPSVTTVLSTLRIAHPNWRSLTSLSIDGPPSARRLYVSSGTSDRIFEFHLTAVPEPGTLAMGWFAAIFLFVCGWRRRRSAQTSRVRPEHQR
jgi:hypothetical protein